jgi:hypothetical protein
MRRFDRRTVLAGIGTLSVAGCIDASSPENASETPDAPGPQHGSLPEACPTTRDLGVEFPDELTPETVESFVEAYEHVYYREIVVRYEPESRVDAYRLDGGVMDGSREEDDGYVVTYSGSGGIYRPTLLLGATATEAPADSEPIPRADIHDDRLRGLLEEAAEDPESEPELHVDIPGSDVEQYLERFESLSDTFELSSPGDSDVLYVDVDGTTVEVTVTATQFHGDYWWTARYYVDEHVVWRAEGADADPRDGELLECRESA